MSEIRRIRLATEWDCDQLLSVYAPYVKNTAISFEYEVPSPTEFTNRIRRITADFPWLVYELGEEIVGYAYASKHRERAAYQWSADLSVYVKPSHHRKGIATSLYAGLVDLLRLQGYRNAYAGTTLPNIQSESFHEAFGFRPVGIYHGVGYKFGQWHDVKWFELPIAEHRGVPMPPKSINELITTKEFDQIVARAAQQVQD